MKFVEMNQPRTDLRTMRRCDGRTQHLCPGGCGRAVLSRARTRAFTTAVAFYTALSAGPDGANYGHQHQWDQSLDSEKQAIDKLMAQTNPDPSQR